MLQIEKIYTLIKAEKEQKEQTKNSKKKM